MSAITKSNRTSQKNNPQLVNTQSQLLIDNEYYSQNLSAFNQSVIQTGLNKNQVEFPIRLNIPRVNWGISRCLAIPFMGDEYYGLRICVNMWLWRHGSDHNLAQQPNQNLTPEELNEIKTQIICPIREIRLWRNGTQIYSCQEFQIGDDGFAGLGVVLGSGKLVSVMFEPTTGIPLINRLRDKYDDYVLDVEFKSQLETDEAKKEKTNITLRTASANLLTRVYSIDARREKFKQIDL